MPEAKVVDLDSANADEDSKNFRIRRLEGQRGIQARSTLLDECKVESRGVRNGLHASFLRGRRRNRLRLVGRGVGVVQWNGGLVIDGEGPLEFHTEVGVLGAAVACIPTEVNVQLQQVGQPSDILGASRLAAGQSSERIEIDRLFAL